MHRESSANTSVSEKGKRARFTGDQLTTLGNAGRSTTFNWRLENKIQASKRFLSPSACSVGSRSRSCSPRASSVTSSDESSVQSDASDAESASSSASDVPVGCRHSYIISYFILLGLILP